MAKEEKPSRGRAASGRRKKDPNAPKRAMCAFFFWMQESRNGLKKPGMGVADVAKAAGVGWAQLNDKTKWEKMAVDDKKRYAKEIAAYKNPECRD